MTSELNASRPDIRADTTSKSLRGHLHCKTFPTARVVDPILRCSSGLELFAAQFPSISLPPARSACYCTRGQIVTGSDRVQSSAPPFLVVMRSMRDCQYELAGTWYAFRCFSCP